jgi:DNA modification methylase
MNSTRVFAPEYAINERGWIRFPSDSDYRKAMFPAEVNQHPAKANVYLVQAIIEYVSNPEDTIMDVMAGTGTIMVGALIGRSVICVEISPKFHSMQVDALSKLENIAPGIGSAISLINLPCQLFLPVPDLSEHIIFSPQYAGILKTKGTDQWNQDTAYDFEEYSKQPLNLGTMSEFLWMHEMAKVYQKCYESIKAGGTMTLIIKDHISAGERVELTQRAIASCLEIGFSYDNTEHFKWAAPGMPYTAARRARGEATVDDEDIIVLRKA